MTNKSIITTNDLLEQFVNIDTTLKVDHVNAIIPAVTSFSIDSCTLRCIHPSSTSNYFLTRAYDYKLSLYTQTQCYTIYFSNRGSFPIIIELSVLDSVKTGVIKNVAKLYVAKNNLAQYTTIHETLLKLEDRFNEPIPTELWEYLEEK